MDDKGWALDSFKQLRPLDVMWDRRDSDSALAGPEDEEDDPAAGTGPAC